MTLSEEQVDGLLNSIAGHSGFGKPQKLTESLVREGFLELIHSDDGSGLWKPKLTKVGEKAVKPYLKNVR